MATNAQRMHLKRLMAELERRRAEIHYAQVRPMRNIRHGGPVYPMTMDCSEAVTCLCKWAGLADPNGNHYDGFGYTGTLLAHLPHYHDPAAARIGALVVFGPGTGEHVGMVYKTRARNPLLFSHGSEAGPILIPLEEEAAAHEPPVTFLSIAEL